MTNVCIVDSAASVPYTCRIHLHRSLLLSSQDILSDSRKSMLSNTIVKRLTSDAYGDPDVIIIFKHGRTLVPCAKSVEQQRIAKEKGREYSGFRIEIVYAIQCGKWGIKTSRDSSGRVRLYYSRWENQNTSAYARLFARICFSILRALTPRS